MSGTGVFSTVEGFAIILIPSIVTLVTLYFSFSQKRKDSQSEAELSNKKNQLTLIFEPLEVILQKHGYKITKLKKSDRGDNEKKLPALRKELEPFLKIIEQQHFLLLPPNLLDAFFSIDKKIPLSRFVKIHNSYYNWLKRELKYPYKKDGILRGYIMDHSLELAVYDLWEAVKMGLTIGFLYITSVAALLVIYLVSADLLLRFFGFSIITQNPTVLTIGVTIILLFPLFGIAAILRKKT